MGRGLVLWNHIIIVGEEYNEKVKNKVSFEILVWEDLLDWFYVEPWRKCEGGEEER